MSLRGERWPAAIVVLHWVGAAVIFWLVALGVAMRHFALPAATVFDLYQQHKSLGFVALALTLGRLGLRMSTMSPASHAKGAERALARLTQALLYALSLAAAASGWLGASSSPIAVPTRVFGLFIAPNLTGPSIALFSYASLAHKAAAYACVALAALHIAGAIKHHAFDRDDTLQRMLGLRR